MYFPNHQPPITNHQSPTTNHQPPDATDFHGFLKPPVPQGINIGRNGSKFNLGIPQRWHATIKDVV